MCLSLTSILTEPFLSASAWIAPFTAVYLNRISYWHPVLLPLESLVFLADDTSHPMPFHRGRGFNHAIADCAKFLERVLEVKQGKVGLEEGVRRYEEEVREREAGYQGEFGEYGDGP
jgi:2-polyprenyl-6-methoxyphenol hydroxylase-like FAD-dependent oxidoreductase